MANVAKLPVQIAGLDKKTAAEIEARISEFEREHEQDIIHGGAGYVDRIQKKDYMIAGTINLVLGIYWLWSVLT